MILVAFDLATATGVCDGEVGGRPRLWSWYLRDGGDTRPQRLYHLARFLRKYFEHCPCDGVVYEGAIPLGMLNSHPKRGGKGFIISEANVAFARGAIGVLEMTCCEFGKPVEALSVQDARQSVLGWRVNKTNKPTKKRVMDEIMPLLGEVKPETADEADAAILWLYACARSNPRLALAYTPLFGDRR
jgi:hypothetical protein